MDTRTRRFGVATSRASAGCSPVPSSSGLVLGLLVDHAAGDSPTWTLVGIGLGILAGVAGFWFRVRDVLK